MEPVHEASSPHRHLFAGSKLEVEAHLINDDPTREAVPAGLLEWILADAEGVAIAEGRKSRTVAPTMGAKPCR